VKELRLPPSNLLMQIANNPSREDFKSSLGFLNHYIRTLLSQAGYKFEELKNILDFGCGVGRFFYSFADNLSPDQRLYGTDINEPCVAWCKENLPLVQVEKNGLLPPLNFDEGKFSLIYACSVFSHLPIEFQLAWAVEMYRCLGTGGCFFFTTHGATFFPTFYGHIKSRENNSSYISALGESGLFMCFETNSTDNEIGQREVGSAFNREAVLEMFPFFELKLHVPCSQLAGAQDAYLLHKPSDALPVVVLIQAKGTKKCGVNEVVKKKTFGFNANGQSKFHALINFGQIFFGTASVQVSITNHLKQIVYESSIVVASSQVLGLGVYYKLSYSTDKLFGEFQLDCVFNGVPEKVECNMIRPILY